MFKFFKNSGDKGNEPFDFNKLRFTPVAWDDNKSPITERAEWRKGSKEVAIIRPKAGGGLALELWVYRDEPDDNNPGKTKEKKDLSQSAMKQLSEWHGGPLTELSEQQVTKIVKAYFDNPFYGSTIEGQVIVANPVVPPVTMPAIISTKPPEARAEIDYNDPDVIARVEAANRLLGTVSMNINGKPTDVVPIEEAVRHAVQLASRVKTPEEIAEEIAALAKKSPDLSKQDQRNTKNGEQPQLSEEMTEQLRLQFAALEKQVGENQAKMALETAVREAYRKFSQPPGLLKRAKALKVAKENLTRRMAAFDHLSRKRILGPIIGAALLGPAETKVKKAEADYLAFQKQIADAIKGAPKI